MNMKNMTAIMLAVNVALATAFPALAAEPKAPKSERKGWTQALAKFFRGGKASNAATSSTNMASKNAK